APPRSPPAAADPSYHLRRRGRPRPGRRGRGARTARWRHHGAAPAGAVQGPPRPSPRRAGGDAGPAGAGAPPSAPGGGRRGGGPGGASGDGRSLPPTRRGRSLSGTRVGAEGGTGGQVQGDQG